MARERHAELLSMSSLATGRHRRPQQTGAGVRLTDGPGPPAEGEQHRATPTSISNNAQDGASPLRTRGPVVEEQPRSAEHQRREQDEGQQAGDPEGAGVAAVDARSLQQQRQVSEAGGWFLNGPWPGREHFRAGRELARVIGGVVGRGGTLLDLGAGSGQYGYCFNHSDCALDLGVVWRFSPPRSVAANGLEARECGQLSRWEPSDR